MTLTTLTSPPPLSSTAPPWLHKLFAALPSDAWQRALSLHGCATQRQRRLPAPHVLALLVASVLFRELSLSQLVLLSGLALPEARGRAGVSSAALTAARQRLGWRTVAAFHADLVRTSLAHLSPQACWRGLRRFALDGSRFKLADSPANRVHFGGHRGRHGHSAFPLLRALVLVEVFSRQVVDLALGPFDTTSEFALAHEVIGAVPVRSLVLLDAGFFSLPLLWSLQQQGSHWLLPLKSNASVRVVERLGPGDDVVEFTTTDKAKARCPSIPSTVRGRRIRVHPPGYRPRWLLTSLLDPVAFPRQELAAQYGERWQVELGLGNVKTDLARQKPLRSRTPDLVRQEVWTLVLVYNLARNAGLEVASTLGVCPSRVSFVHVVERWRWQWVVDVHALAERHAWLLTSVEGLRSAARRPGRRCPREVKSRQSKFPSKKGRAEPQRRWEREWARLEADEARLVA